MTIGIHLVKPVEAAAPHPDDFMVVTIDLEFRAKVNPDKPAPPPMDSISVTVCLPAEEDTADFLEDIAEAIRERRLYGFMVQEAAESPVGCGEWIGKALDDVLSAPKDTADG